MCPEDQTLNLGIWGRHSNQLSYPAGALWLFNNPLLVVLFDLKGFDLCSCIRTTFCYQISKASIFFIKKLKKYSKISCD